MKPNVLLVILDTVRAKSCTYHGSDRDTTTGICEIRSEGVSFDKAISPATWTVPSHAAIFTGKYASDLGVHAKNKILPEGEETIASRLSNEGYSTALITSNPFLTEGTDLFRGTDFRHTSGMRRTLFEDAFDPAAYIKRREHRHGLPKVKELSSELVAPPSELMKNILNALYFKYRSKWKPNFRDSRYDPDIDDGSEESITTFLEWIDPQCQPFYACLNFMEAHSPFRHRTHYLPDWAEMEDVQSLVQDRDPYFHGEVEFTDRDMSLLQSLYEAEIRYLDRQLKTLWANLREQGLWKDTLVIITSDHGEYLGEHDLIFHHHNRLSDSLIHVPLLVKYPEGRHGGTSVDRPVDLTNIYDTIMHITGESGAEKPLLPDIEPGLVKSEYICKEPTHSIEGYLEKYKKITKPSRAIYQGDNKYLLYEGEKRGFLSNTFEDKETLEEFEEIDIGEVPKDVKQFAGFKTGLNSDQGLEISGTVEDRLEVLGYK